MSMYNPSDLPVFKANGLVYSTDAHNVNNSRPKGRIDNTEESLFKKQEWIVDYAVRNNYVLASGGDLFHQRSEQSNHMIGRLLRIYGRSQYPVMIIPGNHDMREFVLSEHDALSMLGETWNFQLARDVSTGLCEIELPSGKHIGVGGTPWNKEHTVPKSVNGFFNKADIVFWMTHFSAGIPSKVGDGELRIVPDNAKEIQGCKFVANGDIHKSFGDMLQEAERERGLPVQDHSDLRNDFLQCGQTTWINPGSVARMSSDQHIHTPSILVLGEENNKPIMKKIAIGAALPAREVFSLRENVTTKVDIGEQTSLDLETKEDESLLAKAASGLKYELENEEDINYSEALLKISAELNVSQKGVETLKDLLKSAEMVDGVIE